MFSLCIARSFALLPTLFIIVSVRFELKVKLCRGHFRSLVFRAHFDWKDTYFAVCRVPLSVFHCCSAVKRAAKRICLG